MPVNKVAKHSIELPVLPKVLLSTQNLLVEGQCALMFYSLSNTLSGHVYATRCTTSATARIKRCRGNLSRRSGIGIVLLPRRKDAQLLDVEYLGQLKAHHQLSLPVVLDDKEQILKTDGSKDPHAYVQHYLSLVDTKAPVMGTVTLGLMAPMSDRCSRACGC